MALNWGIEKVKDWQQISMAKENGPEGWKTNRLVWKTMEIDMGSITEANVDEFWKRIEANQKDDPPFDDRVVLTRDDIVRRIGMWTNVSTLGPRAYAAKLKKRGNR